MQIDPYHFQRELDGIKEQLSKILYFMREIYHKERHMEKEMKELQDAVERTTAVETSAVTLIQGIAAQLAAAKEDPAAIAALATQLQSQADALAAAITANTPAAPAEAAPAA